MADVNMTEQSDSGACNTNGLFCASASTKLPTGFSYAAPHVEKTQGFNFGASPVCRATCFTGGFDVANYKYYDDRLNTFKFWPCSDKIKPSQLAKAGMRYSGSGDRCICDWCHMAFHSWEYFDEPISEHRRHSPRCEYLRMILPTK